MQSKLKQPARFPLSGYIRRGLKVRCQGIEWSVGNQPLPYVRGADAAQTPSETEGK